MHTLYGIGIWFYGIGIRIASLFNDKAKDWVHGRRSYFEQLEKPRKKHVIWFHCASLGEFDQGLPVMELLRQQHPEAHILVSFFSPSGMKHYHKRIHHADQVVYLPLDTKRNAERFIRSFQPTIAIFVKYEFWANHLFAAKKQGTKLYAISALFRKDQVYFKTNRKFFQSILKTFDHFFVQNERSAELLKSIGISEVSVTGDNRFDRVLANKSKATDDRKIAAFKGESEVLICGSTWPIDEKVMLPILKTLPLKVILAPHDIKQQHIAELMANLDVPAVYYTSVKLEELDTAKVLILDTIGQLATAYKYGDIAYVGGGFTGKLHNILEPGVFGLPVLFGPKHERFPEAALFMEHGSGFEVTDSESLQRTIIKVLERKSEIKIKLSELIEKNAGASKKIVEFIASREG